MKDMNMAIDKLRAADKEIAILRTARATLVYEVLLTLVGQPVIVLLGNGMRVEGILTTHHSVSGYVIQCGRVAEIEQPYPFSAIIWMQ